MDYLSFCPSLIEILAHVQFEDVLRCKLVSRSLYTTIQKTTHNLPKMSMGQLIIRHIKEENTQIESVLVSVIKKAITIGITDKGIIIVRRLPTSYPFWKHSRYVKTGLIEFGSNVWNELRARHSSEEIENCEKFESGGVGNGLREVLTQMIRRIEFERLKIVSNVDFPEEWTDVVCQVYHRTASKCNAIEVSRTMPCLFGMITRLKCGVLFLDRVGTADTFNSEMKVIIDWKMDIMVYLLVGSIDSYVAISSLLQNWGSGHFSLNRTKLYGVKNSRIPPSTIEPIRQVLQSLEEQGLASCVKTNVMKRNSDNQYLRFWNQSQCFALMEISS